MLCLLRLNISNFSHFFSWNLVFRPTYCLSLKLFQLLIYWLKTFVMFRSRHNVEVEYRHHKSYFSWIGYYACIEAANFFYFAAILLCSLILFAISTTARYFSILSKLQLIQNMVTQAVIGTCYLAHLILLFRKYASRCNSRFGTRLEALWIVFKNGLC